jgi:transketolase
MSLEPFPEKWRAFGWQVIEADGHSIPQLSQALDKARKIKGQPAVIIAHTVKGKGVSFMENNPHFHGTAPTTEELEQALKELE